MFEIGPDGKPIVAHPEKCTLCGICETHCPDFAIGWTHPPEKSLEIEDEGKTEPEMKLAGEKK